VTQLADAVDVGTLPDCALYEYNGGISSMTPLVHALESGVFPVRVLYEYASGGGISCSFASFC